METEELTDAEVYAEAARLIETYGHLKGRNGDRESGFCASGALIGALGLSADFNYRDHPDATNRWHNLIQGAQDKLWVREKRSSLTSWNDLSYRTKDEVVTFLRELAEESK